MKNDCPMRMVKCKHCGVDIIHQDLEVSVIEVIHLEVIVKGHTLALIIYCQRSYT